VEFVGAMICIISPRAISTDEEDEEEDGDEGFCNFGEFSDIFIYNYSYTYTLYLQ
jgi:hypothetical protein